MCTPAGLWGQGHGSFTYEGNRGKEGAEEGQLCVGVPTPGLGGILRTQEGNTRLATAAGGTGGLAIRLLLSWCMVQEAEKG